MVASTEPLLFCSSPFWDYQLTVNTTNPDLTRCFQRTVLVWLPCAFLLITALVRLIFLYNKEKYTLPWSWLSKTKLALGAFLGILQLMEFLFTLQQHTDGQSVPVVNFVTPIIFSLSMGLFCFIVEFERRKGVRNCGFLFLFWLLFAFLGVVTFRSLIRQAVQNGYIADQVRFALFYVCYSLIVLQFILSIFVEKDPKTDSYLPHNPCPEKDAPFISRISFWWFTGLVIKGYKKALEKKDLWSLNEVDTSAHVVPQFDKHWDKEILKANRKNATVEVNGVGNKTQYKDGEVYVEVVSPEANRNKYKPSLLKCLIKTFGVFCLKTALFKLLYDVLLFVSPQLLKLLIQFTKEKDSFLWIGLFYAGTMLVVSVVQSFILHQYFHSSLLLGMRLRSTIVAAVYRKTLKLSNAARKTSTVGEIVNLMSVDAQRFMDLMTYFNTIWSGPFQIAVSLFFLWQTLGPSVLAGLGVMILLIPINAFLASKTKVLQFKQMLLKDKRVKLMNEILNGIRVLKLYAWESSFQEKVLEIRNKELDILKKTAFINSVSTFFFTTAPVLVSVTTFAVYTMSSEENILDAEKAFVSLSLFNILRFPLSMLPQVISNIVQASVSLKRLNNFLRNDELNPSAVNKHSDMAESIDVKNGSFRWDHDAPNTLTNLNFKAEKGSLIAVVGVVGSGKSSLLSALLGEMEKVSGTVNIKGSVAYVSQQAWIQNQTLCSNVLFGKSFDKDTYDKVIETCALRPDLEMLPAGDQTEIGEKGINLSGGQKQRVNLARALYQDADLYLLDDPLSAVDVHVGKHIFENVIGPDGVLKNKTRILVTHGISYLPKMNKIIVLVDGKISEMGSYQQLLDHDGAFASFLKNYLLEEVENDSQLGDIEDQELRDEILSQLEACKESETPAQLKRSVRDLSKSLTSLRESKVSLYEAVSAEVKKSSKLVENDNKPQTNKLIQSESVETGRVKFSVFMAYIKAVGPMLSVLIVFFFVLNNAASIYGNVWLSKWSDDALAGNTTFQDNLDMRLGVYGALGFVQGLFVLTAVLINAIGSRDASKSLHLNFLINIFKSPMKFFDTTPLGRIVNRFAKDVDVIDITIPATVVMWLHCLLQVISTLLVISISTPFFLVVILPILILYYFIQRFYVATSRQLKRLESVSRSPIYSHFGETITGVTTIRAFGQQERFILESENKVDENHICHYPSITANRWLAIRLEFIGNLIVFFASLFAVLGRDHLSPGIVGLSISYAMNVTQTLNWMVRMTSELETNIVAVERVKEYAETPTEAPWIIENNRPPKDWPKHGTVQFSDYEVRYREDLDLVLKKINCNIKSGEKIGIVGRTGAGKSSLTLALFRILESAGGQISIDGVNIADIGLHDLRSKLTIIPQDPVLFAGPLRMNLDPFDQYTDEKLWQALEHAHLKTFVSGLPTQLNHECSEGGENLSVGQRQLVCLARALLRKSKILILDEATAAIDLETDDVIQGTIRTEFEDCTVLTIAHRLNTILDYTRIMVLDAGRIKEFDDPKVLLQDESSIFYSMAKDAGLV